jgi:16S rRNA (adenine1518-N6/adenine1519-N6)-dimethyltransferase
VAGAGLLGPADIRELAGRLGIRPAKRLGQNFVTDAGTVRRITSLARLGPADVVLEVGPGFGSLTLPLLAAARQVTAVELDPLLAAELPRTVAARAPGLAGRLRVLTADAARVRELPGDPPTALVANLPYNAAVPVLLHLLATVPSLRRGLVMVQAEVADRMTAPPGSRIYGVPSVKLAWYAEVRRAGSVPRSVFWPVPRVDSGLVAFARHPSQGDAGPDGRPDRDEVFARGGRGVRAAAQDAPRRAGGLGRLGGRGRAGDQGGRDRSRAARRVARGGRVRPDRAGPAGAGLAGHPGGQPGAEAGG